MQQLSQPLLTTFKIALTHEFVQKHYSHVKYFPHSLSVKLRFAQFSAEAPIPDVALVKEDTVDPSTTVIQTTFYLWFEHTHLPQSLVQEEAQRAFIENGALVVPTYQTPEAVGLQDHLQQVAYPMSSAPSDLGGGPGEVQHADPEQMAGGLLPAMSPVNTGFSRNSFRCAAGPLPAGPGHRAGARAAWQPAAAALLWPARRLAAGAAAGRRRRPQPARRSQPGPPASRSQPAASWPVLSCCRRRPRRRRLPAPFFKKHFGHVQNFPHEVSVELILNGYRFPEVRGACGPGLPVCGLLCGAGRLEPAACCAAPRQSWQRSAPQLPCCLALPAAA
jgi:hypothetical protein